MRPRAAKAIGVLLALALLGGCTARRLRHPVALRYEGPAALSLLAGPPPSVVVVPFADPRKGKDRVGLFRWHHLTYDLVAKSGPAAESLTRITLEFLRRAGLRPRRGNWDGELDTVLGIGADYAIYGEILQLDFTGRGSVPTERSQGTVRLVLRLGDRERRRVVRRTVEITPDETRPALFRSAEDQLAHLERLIRKAVNRALREGLSDLVGRMTP